ncbi:RrF2 family transcriptional regulator [Patescibacteria group bacterium]
MSRKADYGLLFLSVLAKEKLNDYLSVKKISSTHNVPHKFLSKIASELKEMGVVESKEGFDGGYKLSMKPEDIPLGGVVEHLDGPVAPVSCMRGNECSCSDSCGHKNVMETLSSVVSQTLDDYSLADLIKGKS